ncbi:MAG: HAMP domain-containing sensor histidine kinase [Planctomycetota bacterium]
MRRTFVSGTLFVCLWAVLTFLAPIRSVREAEATTAMLAASLAAAEFDAGLRTAKAHRVTFAAPLPEAESARSLAEAQGLALAARAADAEALTFLTHARQIGMSPRGWLALARLCAGSDGASAALEQATGEAVAIGGVPVAVLARLIDARGGNVRAKARDLADALVRGTLAVPGFAAPAVLDELLATDGSLRADAGVRALLAALDAWLSRGPADWPPTIPRRTGQDVVLLPSGADEVCLLLPEEVARLRERSAARAAASYPAVLCRSTSSSDESADESTGDGTRALAEAVDALAGRWLAEPNGTLVSTWLTRLSWLLLALGALAIVSSQVALARVAKRELRLARLRSDFVDLVSHELRTPLSAMSMRAEMLASGTVPDDKLPHYLHTLHLDVRRLADQVQRVLDFARLESRPALELRRTTARVAVARGVRAGLSALRPVGQSCASRWRATCRPSSSISR